MFRFESHIILYLLLLIPLLVLLFMLFMAWKKRAIKRFGDIELVKQLSPDDSFSKNILKFTIITVVLTLIIICLANPQMGSKVEKMKRKGFDLMVCLDISNSMNAEDIQPSRLQRSKQAIINLMDKLEGDRIGLVIFAGQAYTQLPLTSDYGAAKLFINVVTTDDIRAQGTAIGTAISTAMESFDWTKTNKHNKAIIVISDGENHEDDALEAAKEARQQGVMISTIGMGLPEGAPIPIYQGNRIVDYKRDHSGSVVTTQLNEKMLQEIAEAGGGYYVGANNSSAGIETIYKKLSGLDKVELDEKSFTDYETRFQYPLALALFLVIAEIFIFEKKNKFFSNINLFGNKNNTVK